MNIRFFPKQFLERDKYFGLFKIGDGITYFEMGVLDMPVTIEGDAGIPFSTMNPSLLLN